MLQMPVSCSRSVPAFLTIAGSSEFTSGLAPACIPSRCIGMLSASRLSSSSPTLPRYGWACQKMSHGTAIAATSSLILSLRQPMPSLQTTYGTV
jgi:hypothetical protein